MRLSTVPTSTALALALSVMAQAQMPYEGEGAHNPRGVFRGMHQSQRSDKAVAEHGANWHLPADAPTKVWGIWRGDDHRGEVEAYLTSYENYFYFWDEAQPLGLLDPTADTRAFIDASERELIQTLGGINWDMALRSGRIEKLSDLVIGMTPDLPPTNPKGLGMFLHPNRTPMRGGEGYPEGWYVWFEHLPATVQVFGSASEWLGSWVVFRIPEDMRGNVGEIEQYPSFTEASGAGSARADLPHGKGFTHVLAGQSGGAGSVAASSQHGHALDGFPSVLVPSNAAELELPGSHNDDGAFSDLLGTTRDIVQTVEHLVWNADGSGAGGRGYFAGSDDYPAGYWVWSRDRWYIWGSSR